jgi:hypothetical protein
MRWILVWRATFGKVPPGSLERIAAYAFVLWQVGFGGFLLYSARPVRMLRQLSVEVGNTP